MLLTQSLFSVYGAILTVSCTANCIFRLLPNLRIDADFKGEGDFFPGRVAYCNNDDGTFAVEYQDGDFEDHVEISRIRIRRKAEIQQVKVISHIRS